MDYLDLNQRQQEVLQYIKKVQLQRGIRQLSGRLARA